MAATRSRQGSTRGANDPHAWRQLELAPLILLSGPESYLAARSFEIVRRQVLEREPDTEVTRLDAMAYEAGQLLMAASPSLFGESKHLEIRSLEGMNDDFLHDALQFAAEAPADVTVVMHHGGGNRGKKLLDALKKAGAVTVQCQPLKKDADKLDFVMAEFRSRRRKIQPEAARALVAAVGSDVAELGAACSQLVQDVSGEVTHQVVDEYFGGRVEATGFKVADAALTGRSEAALSTLRHAIATGTDPVPVVAALAVKLRQVAKVIGEPKSSGQLAQELGLPPWQVQQAQEQARYWSQPDLAACLELLAETDHMVKGAARDPEYAVERAVARIAAAAHR
ncbi:DNA polymerase III subunit delta [Zhihengliuella flava]|uniref:DNA-directed DNA polymerase n=1 Tax=Zhihengliuella flava TaxID=1285193 RepID=A0A931D6M2_9MICC|nr:DNA polymerase III subunit delta [Zhihengliuella flava]MBG6083347.1 DNA polymerase-3 subunit delta [Zhihengliuella flava]